MNRIVWGLMTVARHRELKESGVHLHVFLNGLDISDMGAPIIEANDSTGQVLCYRTDHEGRIIKPVEKHVLRGTVEFKEVDHEGDCSRKRRALNEASTVTH